MDKITKIQDFTDKLEPIYFAEQGDFDINTKVTDPTAELPKLMLDPTKGKHLITIDGKIFGYVIMYNYAKTVAKTHLEQLISSYLKQGVKQFRIKWEHDDSTDTYKLYQIAPGTLWNGVYKICTVTISKIGRVRIAE